MRWYDKAYLISALTCKYGSNPEWRWKLFLEVIKEEDPQCLETLFSDSYHLASYLVSLKDDCFGDFAMEMRGFLTSLHKHEQKGLIKRQSMEIFSKSFT